jgi:hypothetical protein
MDSAVLLAQLRSLLESAPDFASYSPTSGEHQGWLAKAHALVSRWNRVEAMSIASAADFMHLSLLRDGQVAKVIGLIHRAIADLEIETPKLADQAFAPGAVYDFFKALSAALGSATTSVFIIDPFLDEQIFDSYLASIPAGLTVRLLAHKYGNLLKPAVQKFAAQHGNTVAVRISSEFHDRIVFVDDLSCWVMGQSIKDAAKAKPTYLLPLPADIASLKLGHYEAIWNAATVL